MKMGIISLEVHEAHFFFHYFYWDKTIQDSFNDGVYLYFIVVSNNLSSCYKTSRKTIIAGFTMKPGFLSAKIKMETQRVWNFNHPCSFVILRNKAHDSVITSSICSEIFSSHSNCSHWSHQRLKITFLTTNLSAKCSTVISVYVTDQGQIRPQS